MFDVAQSQSVEWPRFEEDEMRDLSAYLRTLAGSHPMMIRNGTAGGSSPGG
jgi:hypothetical protein